MNGKISLPQELRDIWTDAYKFHAMFYNMGNTPEEWMVCYRAAEELVEKYKYHRLAVLLLIDVYIFLEDQRREVPLEHETVRPGLRN